ncbi:MAG: ABC transporter ATP-binding protein [candidate division SR1 bacterium]|nr:ABC transporter ATP-binding protein [candidate division SR1 bacterium]
MNAIDIKGLIKTYKNGVKALNGINLEVKEGDFFALLGSNGAGKTTIISILTSIVTKTSGEVKVFGYDLDNETNLVKQSIGVVPQEFNISIFEKVQDIVINQAGYYGMPLKEATKQTEFILKKLDLWEKRDQISKNLSGGMKRRLMIARALVHNPRLLILDEPTAGVDVELRYGMWQYLNELNAQGTTILLTTHYLEEVEQLCKNAAIIKQGEIIKNDSVKNLVNSLDSETYIVNIEKMTTPLKLIDGFTVTNIGDDKLEIDIKKGQYMNSLVKQLDANGIQVINIQPKENRLEKLFLNILSK